MWNSNVRNCVIIDLQNEIKMLIKYISVNRFING